MRQTLSFLGLVIILVFILISFPKELEEVPEQDVARWTRYLAWHPKIVGYDYEISDSLVLLAIIVTAVSAYAGLKWSFIPPKHKKYLSYFYKDGTTAATTGFNIVLSYYILMTGICEIAYWILDVGKLWSATGVLHNTLEIAVLILLHNGGKLKSHLTFAWFGGYTLLVTVLSMKLAWPYDGIWFKVQGLCSDYALIIQFIRIYFSTRKNLGGSSDEQLPLNNQQVLPSTLSYDEFFPNSVSHPNQIILLILASMIHSIGNVANSIWMQSVLAFQVFQLSYVITWPLYAYYIYIDTHCAGLSRQKRIFLPDTTPFKVTFIVILTFTLSVGTIRFAMFVQSL